MVVILLILPDAWLTSGTTARNCMPHRYVSRICITQLDSNSQDHEQSVASTKEEEWVTKKTTELTTTKQVETRVKRQVVLEDGKIIDDSGPVVSTNTKQDTEKQQYETREHRTPDAKALPSGSTELAENGQRGTLVERQEIPPGTSSLVREVQEERVLSREQTDELLETEDVKHLGDIDDESYLNAVRSGVKDLRPLLEGALRPIGGPRVIRHTTNTNRIADTENTNLISTALSDGRIITEKRTTDEHEHITQKHLPEDEARSFDSGSHTCLSIHGEERIAGTRDTARSLAEDGSPGEMRYSAESRHAERYGDPAAKFQRDHWESLSDRLRRSRENAERKDAITKRPLDFDAEERSRKAETNKWLDHHFGSDSRSSQSSRDSLVSAGADQRHVAKSQGTEEGFFNITIRSKRDAPVLVACVPKQTTVVHQPATDKYFQGVSEWSERRAQPVRPARATKVIKEENVSKYQASANDRREIMQIETQRPSPPQRRRHRRQITPTPEPINYTNGYAKEEPPPDYSIRLRKENKTPTPDSKIRPGSHSPPTKLEPPRGRSVHFPAETITPKQTVTSAIGQGIRKLVGKIRSASAERKNRRRSVSPPLIKPPRPDDETTYQKCNVIDAHIEAEKWQTPPTQRYYLGEDPYQGSIYGRENKYASNGKQHGGRNVSSQGTTTLGRYGKNDKTSVAIKNGNENRKVQTIYRAPLTRSKSCLADQHSYPMYRSNPQLSVTHDALKSPSLVVSLVNKSKTNIKYNEDDKKEHFMMRLHQRAPELYKTLQAAE